MQQKEGAPTLWDSMYGTGEHYAKWNKPGDERQIPYDLTFKRNLINKTNTQAKYIQRRWNREQADSDQRGEGMGILGEKVEGFVRTIIKDMWTIMGEKGWKWEEVETVVKVILWFWLAQLHTYSYNGVIYWAGWQWKMPRLHDKMEEVSGSNVYIVGLRCPGDSRWEYN